MNISNHKTSRRQLLAGFGLGAVSVPMLAACTGSSGGGTGGDSAASGSKSVSVGSNYSDAAPKSAFGEVVKAFETANSGITAKVNTVSHNDFQNNINNYLNGSPDEVFTWFSGFRMRHYAKSGLVAPLDELWKGLAPNFPKSIAQAATGDDGKKYLVPWVNYPWAVFYNKEVFTKGGYTVPKTWDEFVDLCKKIKATGTVPIALGDKDGWPAMGTFDYINMRLNGFEFHNQLLTNQAQWTDPKVAKVFDTWKEIAPYQQEGATGRIWQDAATAVGKGEAAMMVIGSDQIVAQISDPAQAKNLDFFPFPEIDPANAQDAVEAPIDGFMLSKRAIDNPNAVTFAKFLGTGAAQQTYLGSNQADVATAIDADTSKYTELQKKMVALISGAKQLSQFFDRDSSPALASNAMIPQLQAFLNSGTFDQTAMASAAKQYFASEK